MPAGIVLAGGRSRRVGTPKAWLDWHGSTLLRRACGIVARGTSGPVLVVRAPGQELPPLPDGVRVVEDAREGQGPLPAAARSGLPAGDRARGRRARRGGPDEAGVPLRAGAHALAGVAPASRERAQPQRAGRLRGGARRAAARPGAARAPAPQA